MGKEAHNVSWQCGAAPKEDFPTLNGFPGGSRQAQGWRMGGVGRGLLVPCEPGLNEWCSLRSAVTFSFHQDGREKDEGRGKEALGLSTSRFLPPTLQAETVDRNVCAKGGESTTASSQVICGNLHLLTQHMGWAGCELP